MKPLKELGFVSVGMILVTLNKKEIEVVDVIIPFPVRKSVKSARLPMDTNLILELDNEEQRYLATDQGWHTIDERILVKNWILFTPPLVH